MYVCMFVHIWYVLLLFSHSAYLGLNQNGQECCFGSLNASVSHNVSSRYTTAIVMLYCPLNAPTFLTSVLFRKILHFELCAYLYSIPSRNLPRGALHPAMA